MPSGKRNDQVTSNRRHYSDPRHDQAAIRRAREGLHGAFDSANVVHADRGNLHSERRRYGLDGAELTDPQ